MGRADGKVVVKETGAGIPDLIVSAYQTAGDAPALAGGAADAWKKIQGGRLGSVATNADGRFALEWAAPATPAAGAPARTAAAARAVTQQLLLVVSAPEEDGAAAPLILYSSVARGKTDGQESFVIRLSSGQLKKAGLLLPSAPGADPRAPEEVLKSLETADVVAESLRPRAAVLSKKRLDRRAATAEKFKTDVRPALEDSLSRVPADVRASDGFVAAGGDVKAASLDRIKRNIREVVNQPDNRPPVQGVSFLTPAQWDRLRQYDDGSGTLKSVPASAAIDDDGRTLGELLAGRGRGGVAPVALNRADPLAEMCRPASDEEACALDHLGIDGAHGDGTAPATPPAVPGPGVTALTAEDVPKFIARLMDPVTPPEGRVVFGAGGRATQEEIEATVAAFRLRPGPADATAFYDFHQLRIAFEPVWQELIDQGLLTLAEDAYHRIVELGGDPAPAPAGGTGKGFHLVFLNEGWLTLMAQEQDPPALVLKSFQLTKQQWNVLPADARAELGRLADAIDKRAMNVSVSIGGLMNVTARLDPQAVAFLKAAGDNILRYADALLAAKGTDRYASLNSMLEQLLQRVKEPYAFTIFAADRQHRSVNFGIVATYRQKWEPVSYQAGRLVKTVPLAPKESRKFSKKVVVKKSRAEKEVLNSLRSRKQEEDQTSRAESDIVGRAKLATNFSLSASGSYNMEVSSGSYSSAFGRNAETSSEETKKDFHEAVFKAAEEVKNERTLEVNTSTSDDSEAEESGEISNPNDELPVTFLFYELQRRYRVFERIQRVTPVVLVAQEVPAPEEVDEDWLVSNDWILRRVLLDDSFAPALSYLSSRLPGDEAALEETRRNVDQQRRVVEQLKDDAVAIREYVGRRYASLEQAMERRAGVAGGSGGSGGLLGEAVDVMSDVENFLLGGSNGDPAEAARLREEAAKDSYEKAAKEEQETRARLEREVTSLNAVTEAYAKALAEHLNRKAQVLRLRVHVKQNILYYMQAVWSHEPPDQRYFRLHQVKVPKFQAISQTYTMFKRPDWVGSLPQADAEAVGFIPEVQVDPDFPTVPLVEVADLDGLMGYKGNYMIFPLKQTNPLTDLMIAPYVDAAMNVHDPDEAGNWTLEEFSKYVCCLQERLSAEAFAAMKADLAAQYKKLLLMPLRNGEEIVVPTDSLFIEALPGSRPILEDFKLMHRAVDVKKAQAEVRRAELENLRMAARLVAGEHEDPDIEKKIVIEGEATGVTIPVDEN